MMTYVAATAEANAKHMRNLAEVLSKLSPTDSIAHAVNLLDQCHQSLALSTAVSGDAEQLVHSVVSLLQSDEPSLHSIALRVCTCVAQSLRPELFSAHCNLILQQLATTVKSTQFDALPPLRRAQVLTTFAAVIAAAAPFVQLGRDYKMVMVLSCQTVLRSTLRILSAQSSPRQLLSSALSVVFAILLSVPRELRSTFSQVDLLLGERCFAHPADHVRTVSTSLSAHLITCVNDKDRAETFQNRLSATCAQLEDILAILDAFSSVDTKPIAIRHPQFFILSSEQLAFRFSSLCHFFTESFSVPLPGRILFPLSAFLNVLCNGLQSRHVDPYAQGHNESALDPDGALLVNEAVTQTCLNSLTIVLRVVARDAVLRHASLVAKALRQAMTAMVLQCRGERGKVCSLALRRRVYSVLEQAVLCLGSSVVDDTIDLFTKLFETDVVLRLRCVNNGGADHVSRNEQLKDVLTAGVGRRRKRRRFDRQSEVQADKESTAMMADELKGRFDESTKVGIVSSFKSAVSAVIVLFDCRDYFSVAVCQRLAQIEGLLQLCVEKDLLADGVLEAVGAASISGGSNRGEAKLSSLFERCSRVVSHGVNGTDGGCGVRRAAFSTRAVCESIIHPRGPPLRHPLKISIGNPKAAAGSLNANGKMVSGRGKRIRENSGSVLKRTMPTTDTVVNDADTTIAHLQKEVVVANRNSMDIQVSQGELRKQAAMASQSSADDATKLTVGENGTGVKNDPVTVEEKPISEVPNVPSDGVVKPSEVRNIAKDREGSAVDTDDVADVTAAQDEVTSRPTDTVDDSDSKPVEIDIPGPEEKPTDAEMKDVDVVVDDVCKDDIFPATASEKAPRNNVDPTNGDNQTETVGEELEKPKEGSVTSLEDEGALIDSLCFDNPDGENA